MHKIIDFKGKMDSYYDPHNSNLVPYSFIMICGGIRGGFLLVQRSCEEHRGGWQGSGPVTSQVIDLTLVIKIEIATNQSLSW